MVRYGICWLTVDAPGRFLQQIADTVSLAADMPEASVVNRGCQRFWLVAMFWSLHTSHRPGTTERAGSQKRTDLFGAGLSTA